MKVFNFSSSAFIQSSVSDVHTKWGIVTADSVKLGFSEVKNKLEFDSKILLWSRKNYHQLYGAVVSVMTQTKCFVFQKLFQEINLFFFIYF